MHIQIFVYNVPHINTENNFPLINFESAKQRDAFICSLKSIPRFSVDARTDGFFVINNPQYLPTELRRLHMYEDVCGSDATSIIRTNKDGYFLIKDNLLLLQNSNISDNTHSKYKFSDAIHVQHHGVYGG
jgi:hypothetical protein